MASLSDSSGAVEKRNGYERVFFFLFTFLNKESFERLRAFVWVYFLSGRCVSFGRMSSNAASYIKK